MNDTRQLVSQYSIRFAKEAAVSNLLRTTCLRQEYRHMLPPRL